MWIVREGRSMIEQQPPAPIPRSRAGRAAHASAEPRAPWTVRVDLGQQLLEVAALETPRGLARWR
jgi:hypothetical protein